MVERTKLRPGLMLALVCHVALSVGYLMLTPAFEGPDENGHYRYAFHLANTGELPLPRGTAGTVGGSPLDEVSMAIHPPLYYRCVAIWMTLLGHQDSIATVKVNPNRGRPGKPGEFMQFLHGSDELTPVSAGIVGLRWLRGLSVLFGLVSILLVYRLARLVQPAHPGIADLAALLVACLPMWSFIHGVLNAGNLSVVWCQLALVLFAGILTRGCVTLVDGVWVGVTLGAALVTKLTGLFLLVLFAGLVVHLWRRKVAVAKFVGVTAAVGLVIALPYFWSNGSRFGDPMLLDAHRATFRDTLVPEGMVWRWLVDGFFPQIFSSLLGQFGWFAQPPHRWLVYYGIALFAAAGFGLLVASRKNLVPRHGVLLAGAILFVFALTLQFNTEFRQPQGRLLFPVIGPIAVLFATGLYALLPRHPGLQSLAVVPPAIGFVVLALHFKPAFVVTDARAPASHLSISTGVTAAPTKARLALSVEPGPTPMLHWQEAGHPRTGYTLYIFDEAGRVWGASYEWASKVLTGTDFVVPESWWKLLPFDRRYGFKLRRLPDRAAGIWPPSKRESNIAWGRKERK